MLARLGFLCRPSCTRHTRRTVTGWKSSPQGLRNPRPTVDMLTTSIIKTLPPTTTSRTVGNYGWNVYTTLYGESESRVRLIQDHHAMNHHVNPTVSTVTRPVSAVTLVATPGTTSVSLPSHVCVATRSTFSTYRTCNRSIVRADSHHEFNPRRGAIRLSDSMHQRACILLLESLPKAEKGQSSLR